MLTASPLRRGLLGLAALLFLAAPAFGQTDAPGKPPAPVDRTRVAVFNVALTGSFALARGWVEGHVDSGRDALRIFASGAAGGYGFYQAKRLIGKDYELPGLALAYTSTSVVENAAGGRHPLSHIRFGPGPVDLQVRTPFARSNRSSEQPLLNVQVNGFSTATALVLPLTGHRPAFRSGTLHFASDRALGQRGDYQSTARAINRTILLGPSVPTEAWRHELVHLVQSLQVGAVTPYYTLSSMRPSASYALGGSGRVAWDLQFDWLYGLFALSSALADYDERWSEIEAYTLTAEEDDSGGWDCPPEVICVAPF